mgnify:CR=1 FL=1
MNLFRFIMFCFIDGMNIILHEGGHTVFGIFGILFITVISGTLMQLAIPFIVYIHFKQQGKELASAAVLFWFGENFLGIGRYMKDAIVQELPLFGGSQHDWTYLFGEFGVTHHCVGIGQTTIILGVVIMVYAGCKFVALCIKKWFTKNC